MIRLLSNLAARGLRRTPASHHGRVYVFLVVVLTVFLLGLACWRQPVTGYTARVGLVKHARDPAGGNATAASQTEDAAQLRDEILSPQAWKSLAENENLLGASDELAKLQQRTTANTHINQAGDVHIVLWHVGPSEEQARAVVQGLAERFALEHSQQHESRRRCQQCDAAQAEVANAASAMKQAKEAVESFHKQHEAELSPAAVDSGSDSAAKSPTQITTQASTVPNPLWHELSDRLDVLRAAHAELLQQRTPEHPGVVDLVWQIAQAESRLAATPRLISPSAAVAPVDAQALATTRSGGAASAAEAKPSPEIVAQLRKLTAVADAAERRHTEALAAERRAWQERWSQPSDQIAIVEPAHIVQRLGGEPSKANVLLVALFSIVTGGVVAWRSQLVRRPGVLVSASQVEHLGLSVVAALATKDGPAIPQPQLSNPSWVRYLTAACELALAAIVALFLTVALADWQIAAQALWDPLSAFADALRRLSP